MRMKPTVRGVDILRGCERERTLRESERIFLDLSSLERRNVEAIHADVSIRARGKRDMFIAQAFR